jgi:hypothetical protein
MKDKKLEETKGIGFQRGYEGQKAGRNQGNWLSKRL